MRWLTVQILILASASAAAAQSSSSYRMSECTLNLGGRPQQGQIATSPSYALTLDSVGDSIAARSLSGPSFHMDGGFLNAFAPPGEVTHLRFDAPTHLLWDAQSAAGEYNVYRGTIPGILSDYGACLEPGVATTEATDSLVPASGAAYFYLVTATNRLGEEGTKGFNSSGAERPNALPCP
jgi:hypothetical protein